MYSKSNNIKSASYNYAKKVVTGLFEWLSSKYQDNLETSIKGGNVIFDSVQLLGYKCHKVNFKRGDLHIDPLYWIKNKKATINPKNEDDKCFPYAATVALNYEQIKCNREGVSNIKQLISKYNWERIKYPSKTDD